VKIYLCMSSMLVALCGALTEVLCLSSAIDCLRLRAGIENFGCSLSALPIEDVLLRDIDAS
jgi:hypothetical protein